MPSAENDVPNVPLRYVTTADPATDPTQVFIVDGKLMTPVIPPGEGS